MKLIVFLLAALYIISPIDLAPGFFDDLFVLLISSGYIIKPAKVEQ
jgi:uncharacterized membrane protein YkvA (DUF1232 family)